MIDWIKTKYAIWKYHRKYGKYQMPVLTQEEYEDFYVSPEDLPMLMDMSKEKTIVEQNISEYGGMYPYKFIFKTNK